MNIIFIFILINLLFALYFEKIKFLNYLSDKPDGKRKIHSKPTPLAGGTILLINVILFFIISIFYQDNFSEIFFFKNIYELNIFLISLISIFILGFFDDKFNLSPNIKILLLSCIIIFALIFDNELVINNIRISFINDTIGTKNLGIIFSLFCILVFLNAFNMFDGMNLQASIYSLTIFIFLSIFVIDNLFFKILIIYLIFYSFLNFKNKTFLGDNGSLSLAFIISYFFIKLYNLEFIKFSDEIFIYMMIPGIDLIRLFFKRTINRRNPLKPDKDHLHHLLLAKFSQTKAIIIIHSLIVIPILLNYLNINNFLIILVSIIIYSLVVKN